MRSQLFSAALAVASTLALYRPAPQIVRPDVLEFLSHVRMWDTVIDGAGHTVRTVVLEGVNLQLVNGIGYTASTNGTGNLLVGYQEGAGFAPQKGGSHNIVGGCLAQYTSYGGLVAGDTNSVSGPFASAAGGSGNVASGADASVSGGFNRIAAGFCDWAAGSLWEDQ